MGIVSGGGGGATYTPPTSRAQLSGNTVSIADNATALLTWDSLNSGTALLNRTTPSQPTIVTAGIYAVAVDCSAFDNLTAGGTYHLALALDAAASNAVQEADSPGAVTSDLAPVVHLALTYYIPAGGKITVSVTSHDGVATVNYQLNTAIVQRIT